MPGWSRQLLCALLSVVAVAALSPTPRAANDSGQTIQQRGNSLIDTSPTGAAILGRVVDGDTGEPLAGVTVVATGVPPRLVSGSGRRMLESINVETTTINDLHGRPRYLVEPEYKVMRELV